MRLLNAVYFLTNAESTEVISQVALLRNLGKHFLKGNKSQCFGDMGLNN